MKEQQPMQQNHVSQKHSGSAPGWALQNTRGQSLQDQMLLRRVAELECIVGAQQKDMAALQKQQSGLAQAMEEDVNAQVRNLQAHVRSAEMDMVEKAERISKSMKDAIDVMEADIQHLRSELQVPGGLICFEHREKGSLNMSVIEQKFADMASIQAELVQLSERCDNETTKLARIVDQMGAKVANVQTRIAQQVVASTSLHSRIATCEILSTPRDSVNVHTIAEDRCKAAQFADPSLCARAGTCDDMIRQHLPREALHHEKKPREGLPYCESLQVAPPKLSMSAKRECRSESPWNLK